MSRLCPHRRLKIALASVAMLLWYRLGTWDGKTLGVLIIESLLNEFELLCGPPGTFSELMLLKMFRFLFLLSLSTGLLAIESSPSLSPLKLSSISDMSNSSGSGSRSAYESSNSLKSAALLLIISGW